MLQSGSLLDNYYTRSRRGCISVKRAGTAAIQHSAVGIALTCIIGAMLRRYSARVQAS